QRAGIARIEGSSDKRLVGRKGHRVDADTQRQGKNRHCGEPGIAEQGACRVTQVLEQGFEQDHQIALHTRSQFQNSFLDGKTIPNADYYNWKYGGRYAWWRLP